MSDKAKIELYGNKCCGISTAACMLLKKKGLNYKYIATAPDKPAFAEMRERGGRSSVPQIFINDVSIGGFDELYELEETGELNKLLGTHGSVTDNQK